MGNAQLKSKRTPLFEVATGVGTKRIWVLVWVCFNVGPQRYKSQIVFDSSNVRSDGRRSLMEVSQALRMLL